MVEAERLVDPSGGEDSTIEYTPPGSQGRVRVRFRCDGLTDRGKVRENNEDNYLVARLVKSMRVCRSSVPGQRANQISEEIAHLLIVADGLGGAAGGETASAVSIQTVEDFVLNAFKWFLHFEPGERSTLLDELRQALERADREVYRRARADRSLAGMGTTLTMAYILCGDLYVAHAGDSRAYLLRDGELSRITRDHTYAQMMLDAGMISPEGARSSGLRNVVTNVVGGPGEGVYVEIHKTSLAHGDVLLLCTDGLTEPVDEPTIAGTLARIDAPGDACRELLRLALDGGGRDNITMIVARYEATEG